MDIVNGVERDNGYWVDGVYHCDCDTCNGGVCICDHKFFMSNEKIMPDEKKCVCDDDRKAGKDVACFLCGKGTETKEVE